MTRVMRRRTTISAPNGHEQGECVVRSDAIRKKTCVFFRKKKYFFFAKKNLASKKKNQKVFFVFVFLKYPFKRNYKLIVA